MNTKHRLFKKYKKSILNSKHSAVAAFVIAAAVVGVVIMSQIAVEVTVTKINDVKENV